MNAMNPVYVLGACIGTDPRIMDGTSEVGVKIGLARCRLCVVVAECGELGRELKAYGVWGGQLLERGKLSKKEHLVEKEPVPQ